MVASRGRRSPHVEGTVHDTAEGVESGGVNEEGRDEVDLAGRIGVLGELRLPASRDVGRAERARLPSERRDERLAIDGELGGAACELGGQVADGRAVISGGAREGAENVMFQKINHGNGRPPICKGPSASTHLMSNEKKSLKPELSCSAAW